MVEGEGERVSAERSWEGGKEVERVEDRGRELVSGRLPDRHGVRTVRLC